MATAKPASAGHDHHGESSSHISSPIRTPPLSKMGSQHPGQLTPPSKDYILENLNISQTQLPDQLTPPATPRRRSNSSSKMESPASSLRLLAGITPYDELYVLGSEIGQGAWSKVYEAEAGLSLHEGQQSGASSISFEPSSARARLLAVKTAAHTMAQPIIKEEARILSYLAHQSGYPRHIITFYGFEEVSCSLVLERACLSISLASGIEALLAGGTWTLPDQHPFHTVTSESLEKATPSEPVCELENWLILAHSLVSSLSWLHSNGVVHGDVKPANILWTSDKHFVFADFSSARLLSESLDDVRPTDAITTMYASPELLKSYSISTPIDDNSARHATIASDTWALACTLLYAATGYEPYAFAGHRMRKVAMAKDGSVVNSYANADDWKIGAKVRQGGLVERVVKPALMKAVDKRSTCKEWKAYIQSIAEEKGIVIEKAIDSDESE